MFGVLKGCSCRFTQEERAEWMSHICGLCLSLRREHGQVARLTTNYDAALLSVLYDAQASEPVSRRTHVCPLRSGIRGVVVAEDQPGTRYAAAVCAMTGATKIADHVADGDGWLSKLPWLANGLASRWAGQARAVAGTLGFDTRRIEEQTERQVAVERTNTRDFGFYARPTELAVGAAFGHTAVLALAPANQPLLEQLGQWYGRIMFLLDSYRDLAEDRARGAFNALEACFDRSEIQAQARTLFREAHTNLVAAFEQLSLVRPSLARKLLVQQLRHVGEHTLKLSPEGENVQAGGTPPLNPQNQPQQPQRDTFADCVLDCCTGWDCNCCDCHCHCCIGDMYRCCSGNNCCNCCSGDGGCNCCGGDGCCGCCGCCDCDC
jgi:hypothetical protein